MKNMKKLNIQSIALSSPPLVSVVIPVFNGSKHLEEAVQSIYKSTYTHFEILLVNDGSTDQSKVICASLSKKYAKVRFYDFPRNKGLGRVLNFALKQAKGNYICRINQDDRMLPHRLATQVRFLQLHKDVVAVGSSIRLFDEKGNTSIVRFLQKDSQIKRVWHIVSPFSDPSVMYLKEVALAVGGYKQEFWPADDTQLWIRMGTVGKLANIAKPVVEVRYHKDAASIKHFRKLAIVTYEMHRWMHEFIEPASISVQLFWLAELAAGILFNPYINWSVYRFIKKILYTANTFREVLRHASNTVRNVIPVSPHPTIAKRSGQ